MAVPLPIHPFPARMAPEIVLKECMALPQGAVVLDPMVGSGTVLRVAAEAGHKGIGYDLDPLAVLMTRVWTTPINTQELREAAASAVDAALDLDPAMHLTWIDEDPETLRFVDYWFGKTQQRALRRLTMVISEVPNPIGDALRIALSNIIITKDRGASLGRDVSHSRPHRTQDATDFDVNEGFRRAANRLAQRLDTAPPPGRVTVNTGDARALIDLPVSSVDAAITSPPYLNAIDYLRGHRLSLVWLGYRIGDLRTTRAVSVGTERRPDPDADQALAATICSHLPAIDQLPTRLRLMIYRYALDIYRVVYEISRVVRVGGKIVLVVGNSCLRGVFVENTRIVSSVAEIVGLQLVASHQRILPPMRRYLPPPQDGSPSNLEKRMRTETVLSFVR